METPPGPFASQRTAASLTPLKVGGGVLALVVVLAAVALFATPSEEEQRLTKEDATGEGTSTGPFPAGSVAGGWLPQSLGSPMPIEAIGGTSATDLWFVGSFPGGCHVTEPDCRSMTLHWDGTWMKREPTTVIEILRGVWASSRTDAWAVGQSFLHWDGTRWTRVPSPSNKGHTGVWGSSSQDVWAVGFSGTLEHFDGTTWSQVPTQTEQDLNGVWGSSRSDVWLVGTSVLRHWDGNVWSDFFAEAPSLHSVHGTGPDDAWAVGRHGVLLHWDGKTWSQVRLDLEGAKANFNVVYAVSRTDVWVGGDRSVLLHWDGVSWSKVAPPNHQLIMALWAEPQGIWAAMGVPHRDHQDAPLTLFSLSSSRPAAP